MKKSKLSIKSNWDKRLNLSSDEIQEIRGGAGTHIINGCAPQVTRLYTNCTLCDVRDDTNLCV